MLLPIGYATSVASTLRYSCNFLPTHPKARDSRSSCVLPTISETKPDLRGRKNRSIGWLGKDQSFRSAVESIAHELQSSAKSLAVDSGRQIHGRVFKLGLGEDFFLASQLLYMYACCGEMAHAEFIFTRVEQPNLFFWNLMVRGYSNAGSPGDVIQLCKEMLVDGQTPNNFTYPFVLKACADLGCVEFGRGVHGLILKTGFVLNVVVVSSLLDMYVKCGCLSLAKKLFDGMPERNIVTWNSMLSGYAESGQLNETLGMVKKMEDDGESPSLTTWNSLIAGAVRGGHGTMSFEYLRLMQQASVRPTLSIVNTIGPVIVMSSTLTQIKETHAFTIRMELCSNHTICSLLLEGYVKHKHMEYASRVLEGSYNEEPELWNTMIEGYIDAGQILKAFNIFRDMLLLLEGKRVNRIPLTLLLPECNLKVGKEIHAYAYRNGLESDVSINNALMAAYSKSGNLDISKRVFTTMPTKDVISWNTMLSSIVQTQDFDQALMFFHNMHSKEVMPDEYTSSSVVHICGQHSALQQGTMIHGYIIKKGLCNDHIVTNALLDMYGKCGCVDDAEKLFDEMPSRDRITWNTLISCYSLNRHPERALCLFEQMQRRGYKPSRVTFIAILSACCGAGLVDEGLFYLNSMASKYGIDPDIEHYACMVDNLARAGQLGEAFQLVKSMPLKPDDCIWGSLLGACRIHRNLELAEVAARYLLELKPENSGYHVLLANIYAEANRWRDTVRVRASMKDYGVQKHPGWSWIEISEEIHTFVTYDKSHKRSLEIYDVLDQLTAHIEASDHVPSTAFERVCGVGLEAIS